MYYRILLLYLQTKTRFMKRFLLFLFIFSYFSISSVYSQEDFEHLLSQLDELVEKKDDMRSGIRSRIDALKAELAGSNQHQKQFIYSCLYKAYSHVNADSALYYIEKTEEIAINENDQRTLDLLTLDKAEIHAIMGFYLVAVTELESVDEKTLDQETLIRYFHVSRSVYGWMSDYSRQTPSVSEYWCERTQQMRDSLIKYETDEIDHAIVLADNYNNCNRPEEALAVIKGCVDRAKDVSLSYALFIMAESYRLLGDDNMQIFYLAQSAITDFDRGVTEYAALPTLASVLFDKKDINRAYRYLLCSMEDAVFCNARLRTMEANEFFPIIDKAEKQQSANISMFYRLVTVVFIVLTIALLVVLYFLRKEMHKVVSMRNKLYVANKKLEDVNKQLENANADLGFSNDSLQQEKQDLIQLDSVKEKYISFYMGRSRSFINRMEKFRLSLLKMIKANQQNEVMKSLKNEQQIEEMQKQFYSDFDNAFLEIHPNFVERFNALFKPEDRFEPKAGEKMTTELRIFALIRMGITDTAQIASFLDYSLPTIYNYRSRIRNKTIVEKDTFEKKVMEL